MCQIEPPVLCGMLTRILYIKGVSSPWDKLLPVAQFLQVSSSMKRFIVCWLGGWPGLKSFCLCTLWLAYQLPCVIPQEEFPNTIFLKKISAIIPLLITLSAGWGVKVVQVLHGLRRFSTAERGWHLGVEGQCPNVVAFGVMIITPWERAFYGCSGKQIVFSCCCCWWWGGFSIEREPKNQV